MDAQALKAVQAPLKARYRSEPQAAQITLTASGTFKSDGITCAVETFSGEVVAGLHPATGGNGREACSGDMLLQALVACAGVTLRAVSTALGIAIRSGRVRASGLLDFRGTLGVDREAPVGFKDVKLEFELDTDANDEALANLLKLTERYCVVYQTLSRPAAATASIHRRAG
jgi:uncharacterized OsmC-like protein